ncbi:MAG TPA: hypothetical protein VGB89_15230, partial [Bacteroidota bacterium]
VVFVRRANTTSPSALIAAPRTSKPGPMFEMLAGAKTLTELNVCIVLNTLLLARQTSGVLIIVPGQFRTPDAHFSPTGPNNIRFWKFGVTTGEIAIERKTFIGYGG